uniref:Uncharacterized protein n=1 Tax=Anguilla anguilla TaxID=7936 RepID=A0A0E9QIW7_ANGAN
MRLTGPAVLDFDAPQTDVCHRPVLGFREARAVLINIAEMFAHR